jgi:hypothetical protein
MRRDRSPAHLNFRYQQTAGRMVHVFVRDLNIAGPKAVVFVLERALQHQCQFNTAMAVIWDGSSGRDLKQANSCVAACL